MKAFIVHTVGFMMLWGFFFLYENGIGTAYPIMICAAIMTLYFFLKIARKPFYLFIAMSGLLFILAFLETDNPYSILLFLFITLHATNRLERKAFTVMVAILGICLLVILIVAKMEFSSVIYFLLFFYLAIKVNGLWTNKEEQREMYGELLGEYRRLKRMALLSEEEARYQERTKIARDIHDSVGHKLTALLMQLEILSIKHGKENYKELKELAKDSLEETRYAVRTLKDREHEGIATILQLIKKLEAESHIMVQFTSKQGILSEQLTNAQSVVLYRVIQEGLTNAMRHTHSKEVQVELGKTADENIEFIIRNKIYEKKPFQEGFGLTNMRKRVEELNGTLSIYQTDDQFILKGMLPIEKSH